MIWNMKGTVATGANHLNVAYIFYSRMRVRSQLLTTVCAILAHSLILTKQSGLDRTEKCFIV